MCNPAFTLVRGLVGQAKKKHALKTLPWYNTQTQRQPRPPKTLPTL